jgi:site-specific recombinase XerD
MNKKMRRKPRRILRIPDLDHAETSVLSTFGSADSQRCYRQAIDHFVAWYCSEPRLAFNKTVVLRYRLQLEAQGLASSTINVRLAAVRRLAYEAADSGLLSPELAASISRVKGPKKIGVRIGNWLTAHQGRALLATPDCTSIRRTRDYAVLAILLGCGLLWGLLWGPLIHIAGCRHILNQLATTPEPVEPERVAGLSAFRSTS